MGNPETNGGRQWAAGRMDHTCCRDFPETLTGDEYLKWAKYTDTVYHQ